MMPENSLIPHDRKAAESGTRPSGIAWIFIESGFAPKLAERRIDWPVLSGNSINSVSIAVADPVPLPPQPRIDGSELLADVDAIFLTEFMEYRINEALRALASALAKGALQYTANRFLGPLGGLGAAVYSIASTGAEIRTWATLPKQIYLMRVKKYNSGLIKLSAGGIFLGEIELPADGNHLVYIRMPGGDIKPKIIKLN
jgi:hypothetical protein